MIPEPRSLDAVRPAEGPAIEALLGWLDRCGARFPKLAVEIRPVEGRGVYAREPIAAREEILRIPARATLSLDAARRSGIGRALVAAGVAEDIVLAGFLLQERYDPASFFRPYLDLLPRSYPQNPLFYDAAHLALLEGSLVLDLIEDRRQVFHREHVAFSARIPGFGRFSEAAYVWARLVVLSRNLGLTIGGAPSRALVPMVDFLNHAIPSDATWFYDDDQDEVVLRAKKAIPAGAEVRVSYGPKSNRRCLLHYGFTVDDNPDDEGSLLLRLPEGDPLHALKRAALQVQQGEVWRSFLVPFGVEGDAAVMLSYLRVAVADREDFATLLRWSRVPAPAIHGHPVSARNEGAALAALARACEESLARFPQSIEEDDRLLQDPGIDVETRHAVTVRRGEKRVIGQWLALCRFAAPLLERSWADLTGMARRRDPGWGPFDAYMRSAVIPALARDPWRALEAAKRRERRMRRK